MPERREIERATGSDAHIDQPRQVELFGRDGRAENGASSLPSVARSIGTALVTPGVPRAAPPTAFVVGIARRVGRQLDRHRTGEAAIPFLQDAAEREHRGERERREIDHRRDQPGQEPRRAVAAQRNIFLAGDAIMLVPLASRRRISSPSTRWRRG